jgi:hypothetical protein
VNLLGASLSLAALGVSAFLAVYVLGMHPRSFSNRAFFALMMTFVWWDACEAIERTMPAGASQAALFPWAQGVWLGISAVPAALIQLGLVYPERRAWFRRAYLPLIYAPVVGWAYLIFGTPHLIAGVANGFLGPGAVVGDRYLLLAFVYAVWFYVGVALFVSTWLRLRGSNLRQMQGVVVLGLLIGSVPAGVTEMFWPLLDGFQTRLGLGSVYTLLWSIFLAFAIARYRYLVIEPVTEPPVAAHPRHPLARGFNYLVLEPGRAAGMGAFREIVSKTPGLCVTGLAPARVAQKFGLERTPVLWITTVASAARTVRPQGLDFELVHTVLKFQRENPGSAVLLDDLDYLAAVDGFEAVARFLKRVANQASSSEGTLIVTAGHGTFTTEQVAVLGGCVDHVLDISEVSNGGLSPSRDHAFLFTPSQDIGSVLPLAGVRGGLVVTTEHPAKARRRLGEGFEILWITEHPEPGIACARPTALDTEARRAITAYLAAHPGTAVVLAGLEQLALYTEFAALLVFVKDTVDAATLRGSRVVVAVSPNGLRAREAAMIARRLDVPAGPLVRSSPPGGPSTTSPGSRTPIRGPVS